MREAVYRVCRFAVQGDTHHRLTPAILRAVKLAKTGAPGFRRLTADNVSMLEGFRWRGDAGLRDVLLKDCAVQLDLVGGKASLSVNGLVPQRDIVLQETATHLQLTLAVARIDYDGNKEMDAFERSGIIKATSGTMINVGLSVDVPPGDGNLILVGVGYQVMQEVNGQMAGLTEGSGFEIVQMRVV
jgi:hypothetical protein